ncbi:hypothetical protein [Asticcacaulis sp. 201]|uniref:hypothetical protein n=1 Tax=Asticcacaulis sp. 201 TaxID=3028787 RepID=UPI002915E1C8|nr:hypothetical protein [Asticcacaulis sp. 201]MDV6330603.1 hypothetical protein [Asticcacaulis sp. 201]
MKRPITATLVALSALFAYAIPQAFATDASFGYISNLYAMNNGAILFYTSGTRTNPLPACSGPGLQQRYALDASTTAGQAYASVLLTAYTLHKQISVHGTGTCTIWSDTETVMFFNVAD